MQHCLESNDTREVFCNSRKASCPEATGQALCMFSSDRNREDVLALLRCMS